MTPVHYAIGDVHGRDDLLARMHGRLRAHHALAYGDRPAVVVHLGDMIDRGPDSAAVIDRVRAGVEGMSCVALMGNHEALMLDCLAGGDRETWRAWLALGGDAALRSFGLPAEALPGGALPGGPGGQPRLEPGVEGGGGACGGGDRRPAKCGGGVGRRFCSTSGSIPRATRRGPGRRVQGPGWLRGRRLRHNLRGRRATPAAQ